ncbi:Hypothetical predicted protein [Cloeon dipterum]|uniref:Secreted protein n=1 Tax=Cloeon dipterum TaxID=197152 RepID=A0A8S1CX36_9INSE|nr:Hypothetical predicted protein [Cloeon dipterum]
MGKRSQLLIRILFGEQLLCAILSRVFAGTAVKESCSNLLMVAGDRERERKLGRPKGLLSTTISSTC